MDTCMELYQSNKTANINGKNLPVYNLCKGKRACVSHSSRTANFHLVGLQLWLFQLKRTTCL